LAAAESPLGVGIPRVVLGVGVAAELACFEVSSRNFFSLKLVCFIENLPTLPLSSSFRRKGVDAISPQVIRGLASTPGIMLGVDTGSYVCPVFLPDLAVKSAE